MTVVSTYVIAIIAITKHSQSLSIAIIAMLSDWLKRLVPVFQPMRSKTKINPTIVCMIFPTL